MTLRTLFGRILGNRQPHTLAVEIARSAKTIGGLKQPLQMVPGGPNAPLLGPQPVDGDLETIDGSWIGQLKVDGIRAFYIEGPDGPLIVTREGQPLNCALHCLPGLRRVAEAYGEPMVIDGEYVEEEGFDATLRAFRKGEGQGVFWMFDAVPYAQWVNDRCTAGTALRLARLRDRAPAAESPFVGMLEPWGLNGPEQIGRKVGSIWAQGYEGIVLKDPDAPYRRQRSKDWVRLKETVTHDCPVMDMLRKKDGGFTGLLVKGPTGAIKVTSGFSPRDISHFHTLGMMMLDDAIGADWPVVEVSYIRRAGTTKIGSVRFVRIRADKSVVRP